MEDQRGIRQLTENVGDLCSMHKGLAQVFDAGGFREDQPAVAWRETEWNCRCALRMRLQACSGAERQNGMEQMGKQVYGRHEARMTSIFLLWEREVAK